MPIRRIVKTCDTCFHPQDIEQFSIYHVTRFRHGLWKTYECRKGTCKTCRAKAQKEHRLRKFIDSPLYIIMGGTL